MSATLKHRWSIRNNHLAGITAGDWFKLLRENHFDVDPAYWHRAAFVTLLSGLNSIQRKLEESEFEERIANVSVMPPLFILGHWRSGTTHLHNLLAQDTGRFAYPNTYQVTNPHSFLRTEESLSRRFGWMVPKTRPMDAMELNFQSPQEDELALCLMSQLSPYLEISFPRNEETYGRHLTFRDVPGEEVERWKNSFIRFLRKLTFKYEKPLLLKSPSHTARVRLLLEMFPDARFVHIHRDPYQVFQSCRHYYDTATWFTYLQRPDLQAIDDRILRRHVELYDAFFEERVLIPEGRFHEVRFEDLEREPVAEIHKLYNHLQLGNFDCVQPKVESYLNSVSSYRKNEFPPLDEPTRKRVASRWRRGFDEWHYPI